VPRSIVTLTAAWGNDDAESTIKVSPRQWAAIQAGAEYTKSAPSFYEGRRSSVHWHFNACLVTITGEDGMECVPSQPIDELLVVTSTPLIERK